jgi:hypothetical protein
MYFCPNCGGELQFDIASGMMKCGNCMSTFNPADMGAVTGAQESHEQMSQGMAQDVTGAMGSNTAFDMQQVQQQPQQQADQQKRYAPFHGILPKFRYHKPMRLWGIS